MYSTDINLRKVRARLTFPSFKRRSRTENLRGKHIARLRKVFRFIDGCLSPEYNVFAYLDLETF